MNGSMNVARIKETYVHLRATPFYVEGLTMVPMLGQLIVLTAGGLKDSVLLLYLWFHGLFMQPQKLNIGPFLWMDVSVRA